MWEIGFVFLAILNSYLVTKLKETYDVELKEEIIEKMRIIIYC